MTRPIVAVFVLAALAAAGFAVEKDSAVHSYPLVGEMQDLEIGVRPLSRKEVKKRFVSSLHKNYLVLEVMLQPKDSKELELAHHQFFVQLPGSDARILADEAEEAAWKIRMKNGPQRTVAVAPVASVGYESGRRNHPYGNRRGGVYTNVGVGVGVGSTPGLNRQDERVMAQELADKELQLGKVDGPVAGYLYFPIKARRNQALDLVLELDQETIRLSFKRP